MSLVLYLAAGIQLGAALLVFMVARSAMHETTAAVAVAGGVAALGLARLVQYQEEADQRRKAADRAKDMEARSIRAPKS